MPPAVKHVWDKYVSITITGDPSRGQYFYFILKENRDVKATYSVIFCGAYFLGLKRITETYCYSAALSFIL